MRTPSASAPLLTLWSVPAARALLPVPRGRVVCHRHLPPRLPPVALLFAFAGASNVEGVVARFSVQAECTRELTRMREERRGQQLELQKAIERLRQSKYSSTSAAVREHSGDTLPAREDEGPAGGRASSEAPSARGTGEHRHEEKEGTSTPGEEKRGQQAGAAAPEPEVGADALATNTSGEPAAAAAAAARAEQSQSHGAPDVAAGSEVDDATNLQSRQTKRLECVPPSPAGLLLVCPILSCVPPPTCQAPTCARRCHPNVRTLGLFHSTTWVAGSSTPCAW